MNTEDLRKYVIRRFIEGANARTIGEEADETTQSIAVMIGHYVRARNRFDARATVAPDVVLEEWRRNARAVIDGTML